VVSSASRKNFTFLAETGNDALSIILQLKGAVKGRRTAFTVRNCGLHPRASYHQISTLMAMEFFHSRLIKKSLRRTGYLVFNPY
jgi:hypothetical protein